MKSKICLWMIAVAVLSVAAGLLAGCEAYSSDSREITISPATAVLVNDENRTIVFTASGSAGGTNLSVKATSTNELPTAAANDRLYYPLKWTVSNPELGNIMSSAGDSAVYQSVRNRTGINTVLCQDQSEREGLATVTLSEPAEEVTPGD